MVSDLMLPLCWAARPAPAALSLAPAQAQAQALARAVARVPARSHTPVS